ncbi:dienelactone hydrolase family protein [SAR202 cluster bacterium AD-802-E10_MRT_200m]|nr:dienelactone hydrolase family protein [SAR202 cluster bacterium AD-802-E10_MRT_200m]
MYQTDMYEGMLAETITLQGHNDDVINAYFARPLGSGPFPSVVLVHHLPGWDEWYKEITRRFAHHGYLAICPNLYYRDGHGTPEDVAAKVRSSGGVSDDQVIGDISSAREFLLSLPIANRKIGIIGTCSGGRHTFLVSCRTEGFHAAVECWGGRVVMSNNDLSPKQPVAPIDYTKDLSCPLLGLFGEDDQSPSPEQVALHEQELKKHNKVYEFHMYKNAGHGFFYYNRPSYRQEQAEDGWNKVFTFFNQYLSN